MEDVFEEPNKYDDEEEKEKEKPKIRVKNATDLQRLKLEKLMQNPEKPVIIPERPQERKPPPIPDFVRNVMGSSAGAGSGEFHVYRHLRRKEFARQKYIQMKSLREEQDAAYHRKLEENARLAKEATAKKRAKRLRRKERQKRAKLSKGQKAEKEQGESSESHEEEEGDDEEEKEDNEGNKNDEDKDDKTDNKNEKQNVNSNEKELSTKES